MKEHKHIYINLGPDQPWSASAGSIEYIYLTFEQSDVRPRSSQCMSKGAGIRSARTGVQVEPSTY